MHAAIVPSLRRAASATVQGALRRLRRGCFPRPSRRPCSPLGPRRAAPVATDAIF
jgi:hypothetical protein